MRFGIWSRFNRGQIRALFMKTCLSASTVTRQDRQIVDAREISTIIIYPGFVVGDHSLPDLAILKFDPLSRGLILGSKATLSEHRLIL
jgi:hypothetical protein